ncbi:hypothetical protein AUJ14_04305 [Candidatus Micrarchaeota archaeon CG1_02_55_22]|nr:MAG: hypothetical protein AUJ14_04305 [Candidatus Micrarchaeota archaeon CG1_02_55_22]
MVVLYTHTDFDGIVSAVLISSVEDVSWIDFTEPTQIQNDEIEIKKGSIISDLPYHSNCGLWFDHHASSKHAKKFEGAYDPKAPSAARVIYEYYDNPYLRDKFAALVEATDKIDQANFSLDDIKNPSGYYLLSLSLDGPETASESMAYKRELISLLKSRPLEKILSEPRVVAYIEKKLAAMWKAEEVLHGYSRLEGSVAVVDLRNAPGWLASASSRWYPYLAFPNCRASLRIKPSKREGFVDVSVGENIFKRDLGKDAGAIMKRFGGGGHAAAAGCKLEAGKADAAIAEILAELNA